MLRITLAGLAAAMLLAGPAAAQEGGGAEDRNFSLSLGLFVTSRDTVTTITGETTGEESQVNFEQDLDLPQDEDVFRVDGFYKFTDRHRIDFSWFDLSRSGTKEIERDIEWNDTVFEIDTNLDSDFGLQIYKLAYTWSFLRSERNFLGLTAGLYVADFDITLDSPATDLYENTALTAPLPVFGLRGQYFFTEKLSFRASGEFFLFEYEDWEGDLYDVYAGLDYQWFDQFAVGVGYNNVAFNLDVAKTNFNGNLDLGYAGLMVFGRASF